MWTRGQGRCFVALTGGAVVGTFTMGANRGGLGDHVATGSFMVDPAAHGRGIGRAMGERALEEARAAGFRAMQFNFVIAENEPAVALWRKLGFEVVGRLPGAFHWRRERYVDALVMYRHL